MIILFSIFFIWLFLSEQDGPPTSTPPPKPGRPWTVFRVICVGGLTFFIIGSVGGLALYPVWGIVEPKFERFWQQRRERRDHQKGQNSQEGQEPQESQ